MKKLLFTLLFLLAMGKAHAATCPISSGASQSTIQSTINSCGTGNMVTFAAGTYNTSSAINWPCGVSISGPVVPYPGPYTATINFTGGSSSAFNYPFNSSGNSTSCSTSGVVFQYMNVNGNRPSDGGGAIYLSGNGGIGPTIQYNNLHGVQTSPNEDFNTNEAEIYIDGSGTNQGFSVWTGVSVLWNIFGAIGDCSNKMNTFFYPSSQTGNNNFNYNNHGGFCNAVNIHTSTTSLTISYNRILSLEQGFKFQEPNPNGGQVGCSNPGTNQYCHINTNVLYNDFAGIHRIGVEAQDTPNNTMNFNYNDWHDPINPGYGSWVLSLPQFNQGASPLNNLFTNANGNLTISNVNPPTLFGQAGGQIPGFEFWGNGTENYNLFQGNNMFGVHYGWGLPPWAANNNTLQGNGTVFGHEEGNNTPSNTGNTQTGSWSVQTSLQPNMSPGSQTFSSTLNWTVQNPAAALNNRDTNTNAWCTTDGSTPVPNSGTSKYYLAGTGGTVTSTTTVKCVGMWGQFNQPVNNGTAYPTGYGYQPSAVVSATYTGGGTPTTATPVLNPTSQSFSTPSLSVSVSDSSPSPTIHCTTDGTTPTTGSPVYSGPFTVTNTTTIQCMATSSGLLNSGIGSGTYARIVPTLTDCFQSNTTPFVNTLTVGGLQQQTVMCDYSTGASPLVCSPGPDANGSSVTAWGSTNLGIISVGNVGATAGCSGGTQGPGCVKGIGAGAANVTATVNGTTACGQWTFTVSTVNPTLSTVTIVLQSGLTSIPAGNSGTVCANLAYTSPTENTQICGSGADTYGTSIGSWTSSSPSNATIGASTGILVGVAAGSTNLGVTATPTTGGPVTGGPTAITVTTPIPIGTGLAGAVNFSGNVQLQ